MKTYWQALWRVLLGNHREPTRLEAIRLLTGGK